MINTTTPSIARTPITMFSVAISFMVDQYNGRSLFGHYNGINRSFPHGEPEERGGQELQAGDHGERSGIAHVGNEHTREQWSARMPDISDGALHAHAGAQRLEFGTVRNERGGRGSDNRFTESKPGQEHQEDRQLGDVRNTDEGR